MYFLFTDGAHRLTTASTAAVGQELHAVDAFVDRDRPMCVRTYYSYLFSFRPPNSLEK